MFGNQKKKRSFFERLTGVVPADDFDEFDFEERDSNKRHLKIDRDDEDEVEELQAKAQEDGQLAVDVLNTEDAILIRAMLAGVKPTDIDIDIARDMVTIRGTRQEEHEVSEDNYYHKELFWGSFSRNILLPEEVDVDQADASEKNGLLTLTLPKLDKNRKAKLHVKSK